MKKIVIMAIATLFALVGCKDSKPAAIGPKGGWIPVLADSPKYQNLAGAELLLVGRVASWGASPAGRPEQTKWSYAIQMDTPWLPVADLRDCQGAFDRLRGRRSPLDFSHVTVLVKAKLKRDRSLGKRPVVVVGWMRHIRPDEGEWNLPWPANLPVLPPEREVLPILLIAAFEAATAADSALGYSGVHHARQHFKVLTVFHGDAKPNQRMTISYSYLEGIGRDVAQGERVIWVMTGNQEQMRGYAAIPDTPYHRKEARDLAARVRAAPKPTRFDLLDLSFDKAKVATSRQAEVPDLFAESPRDSGTWELHKEVSIVYSGPDGAVYFVPEKKLYYVRRGVYSSTGARSQPNYFGPFKNDPSLLPSRQMPTAPVSGRAEGRRD